MALPGIFQTGSLLGPIAPGLSGAINPLTFIGSGMATGNMAGAMDQMANIQQNAQLMAQRQAQERAANIVAQARLAHEMSKPTGTSLQQNLAAAGLTPGTPEYQKATMDYLMKSGTTVNVGGAGPEIANVQPGMARVPDSTSPTGFRDIPQPGAKVSGEQQRAIAIATEQQQLLDKFIDGLKDESGNLDTTKLAQARLPGTQLNNLLGRITQNEVYLKSGAAASIGEQITTAASIQPSIAQIIAGSSEGILGQLEQSRQFADLFLGETPEPSAGGPQVGDIENGYIFKGGDPADPNNWEQSP